MKARSLPPNASDGEIAAAVSLHPIVPLAKERLGLDPDVLTPYGHYKAKLNLDAVGAFDRERAGKLVLVTAISPTPAGEGKTTTSVGLNDALNRLGVRSTVCLREPSLGPCFGMKGGATGGGWSQVGPMADINLHFNGDLHAISAANNPARRDARQSHVLEEPARDRRGHRFVATRHRSQRPCVARSRPQPGPGCPTQRWIRHHRGLGDHGDPLPCGGSRRPRTAHREYRDCPQPQRRTGLRTGPRCRRLAPGVADRRPAPEPGAEPRRQPRLHPRRPVRQHRPRLQLGGRDPDRACAVRRGGDGGRFRCRPGRGEVPRYQVPPVRPASRRGCPSVHGSCTQDARRRGAR